MLDIKFVTGHPDLVKKDLKRRGAAEDEKLKWVDELVAKHDAWKKLKEENDQWRNRRNILTRDINELRKQKKDISAKIQEAKDLPQRIAASDKNLLELDERIAFILQRLPNILHQSVPFGKDDSENKEVKRWGNPIAKKAEDLKSHGELLEELDLADFSKAATLSGAGFYFLKGDLVRLEMALVAFATAELEKKGFGLISPPLMMRRTPYEGVVSLQDFENVMYKIDEKGEESYLIATSEHPIAALMMNETFEERKLPLRLCGISNCFRREIGSHGVDTRGLFRVHQFTKVEQFVFCKPDESWAIHEELLANSEQLLQKLNLPYRVVNVCSGDIGTIASKKYDIEAWFPRQQSYREVVSCSNCTNYQAVSLNIRYADKRGEKDYVHTLNSTAIATGRIMVAIIENYQNQDGTITVPKALVPYLGKTQIGVRE